MVITITCEEKCIKFIESNIGSKVFSFGIIIGQKNEDQSSFCIIHAAPLPVFEEKDDDVSIKNINSIPNSLLSINESIVSSHARQVLRMLPGGFDILGVYVTMPLFELNSSINQGKIKKLLSSIYKASNKYIVESDINEKLVLYGCTQSSKTGVKSMNINEHGSTLVGGNLKIQATTWTEVDYNYYLSYPIYFSSEKSFQSLCKNVLIALKPWIESVENSTILIDNKLYNEDDRLLALKESTPSRKKGNNFAELKPPKVLNAMFLQNLCSTTDSSELKETSGSVLFTGTIAGRAFLNSKATAKETFKALKQDLIRSVIARWEMHCDSLVDEPLGSSFEDILHEPPRRVFLEGGGLPISLCDYLFPGDSVSDACQSAQELLNITVNEENVDDSLEKIADISELLKPETTTELVCDEVSSVGRSNAFLFVLALIFVMIAVAFSYLISTSKQSGTKG